MPLLANESIAERAQQRESFRLSNVSSRLTRRETEHLDALAQRRGLQRGEFIRKLILDELVRADAGMDGGPMLTEVVGVQLLLMNILKPIATGQPMTAAVFDNIVAEVHRLKKIVARKLIQEGK